MDFSPRVNDEAELTDVERENKNLSQLEPCSDQPILVSRTGSPTFALTDFHVSGIPETWRRIVYLSLEGTTQAAFTKLDSEVRTFGLHKEGIEDQILT